MPEYGCGFCGKQTEHFLIAGGLCACAVCRNVVYCPWDRELKPPPEPKEPA